MVLFGLILLILGAVIGVIAVVTTLGTTTTVHLEAVGVQRDATALELVIAGGIAVLLVALGWAVLASRARRRVRIRREQREEERLADVERAADAERTEHQRRMEEAGLRDEDLKRREAELTARHEELESRDQDLSRREAAWRQQVGPSVADVVAGRAQGNVSKGTAEWVDDGTDKPGSTRR